MTKTPVLIDQDFSKHYAFSNGMHSLASLKDLYAHMQWADAQIWAALKAAPSALEDEALHERMFHIHYTQCSFLNVWKGDAFKYVKSDAYPTFDAVEALMKGFYEELPGFVNGISDSDLTKPMVMPWAPYFERQAGQPAQETTLGETMLQVASHSVHHRAQVNLQIREHDGAPPMIDYIIWLWLGRP